MTSLIHILSIIVLAATTSLAVVLVVSLLRQFMARMITDSHLQIIRGMADGVIVSDAHGNILAVNESAQKVLGSCSEIVKGKPIRSVFTALRDLPPQTREYAFSWTGNEGSQARWYDARYSLIQPEKPNSSRAVIVIRDVTERVLTSRRELEANRDKHRAAMLHEFVTNISHDLFTPLSSIKLSDYLLQRMVDQVPLTPGTAKVLTGMRERLDLIELQTTQIEHILRDMMEMVKLDSRDDFALHIHQLNTLVDHGASPFRMLALEHNQQITLVHEANLPPVLIDRDRVGRVLHVLLQNAIDYSPKGGLIEIRTRMYRDCATIEVKDCGEGIPREQMDHIFEPFYRADQARTSDGHGSGLSLAIARKIIVHHGGSIEVESKPGKGTTFRVLLPAVRTELPARGSESHHALTLPRRIDALIPSTIDPNLYRPSSDKTRHNLASS